MVEKLEIQSFRNHAKEVEKNSILKIFLDKSSKITDKVIFYLQKN